MTAQNFFDAVKAGDQEKITQLVDADPGLVHAKDENGISAPLLAIYCMHREVAEFLVGRGAQLNFFEAAAIGRADLIRLALEQDDALATAYSPDGFSALGLASFFGNTEVAVMLLAHGADPSAASKNKMRVTPLHSAIANRDKLRALELAKVLLERGAQVNVAQEGGWTPLHEAAAHGQIELLKMLLAKGADANAKSADGRLPADMAAQAGHEEAAALLRSSLSTPA